MDSRSGIAIESGWSVSLNVAILRFFSTADEQDERR
jgi:hypothetical protein